MSRIIVQKDELYIYTMHTSDMQREKNKYNLCQIFKSAVL